MTGRATTLLLTAGAAALALSTITATPAKRYVWNVSGSIPVGLYRLKPTGDLSVTQLVAVQPPEPLATLLADQRYLPRDVPMLKCVRALPGQIVCRDGLTITVDNIAAGEARERDSRGRPLPVWQGCRVIAAGEVFLLNWRTRRTRAARYFAVRRTTASTARGKTLWASGG